MTHMSSTNASLGALIIGYGYMGRIRRKVIESRPELRLVAICDPHWPQAQRDAATVWFDDYRAAIESTKPDVVFVCTPNSLTPEVCVLAMRCGAHVFCEKPPGRNVEDIERIRAAERTYARKVMFGFNHRHHPAILEAKALVDAGRLGRIMWMRGVYGKSGGPGRGFERSWRNDPAVAGGGILIDQGIHMLDLFRFFCGDFETVTGVVTTSYWNVPVEDNAFVILRNSAGQVAQLHSSATLWKHTFNLVLGLEEGYLTVSGLLSQTGSYGREMLTIGRKPQHDERAAVGNPREEVIYCDHDASWDVQVIELVRCIREDAPVIDSSSEDALRVMQIVDEIYRQNCPSAVTRP
jgi:predicted dehydrogenase